MRILIAMLFATSLAWGQSVAPATQNNLQMQGHPEHTAQVELNTGTSLLTGGETSASGTLPLSDFASAPEPQPSLGTIAKEYREGHAKQRPLIRVIP